MQSTVAQEFVNFNLNIPSDRTDLIDLANFIVSKIQNIKGKFNANQDYYLSQADEKKLKEILEKDEKGELRFLSFEESYEHSNKLLKKLGAKI